MTQTRFSHVFGLVLVGGLAFAQPRPPIAQQLTFTPYHASGIYDVGETVGWTVTPGPVTPTYAYKWTARRNNAVVAQGGQAGSFVRQGHDRSRGRPAGDDLRRGRAVRRPGRRRRCEPAPRPPTSEETRAATTGYTRSARPWRRRRSGSRRRGRTTSTRSGTPSSRRRPRFRSTRSSRPFRRTCRVSK